MTDTMESLDPFGADGATATLELHRRRLALDARMRALRRDHDERRRNAVTIAGECPTNGVLPGHLLTEDEIDEAIDNAEREWTSPEHRRLLGHRRALLKAELAEYRTAREAWFARAGLTGMIDEMGAVQKEIDGIVRAISDRPVRTMVDLAARLDLVLAYDLPEVFVAEDRDTPEGELPVRRRWHAQSWSGCDNLVALFVALHATLPDFEFSPICEAWHDYGEAIAKLAERQAVDEKDRLAAAFDGEAFAELRRRGEAVAAEYDTPLPAGDAGLIEAGRRQEALQAARTALCREVHDRGLSLGLAEDRALEPNLDAAEEHFYEIVRDTPPATPAGVAVKLRQLRHGLCGDPDSRDPEGAATTDAAILDQCIDALDLMAGDKRAPAS
jgi:hypothetical protein